MKKKNQSANTPKHVCINFMVVFMLGLTFWTSTHQSLNWADNYWQCLNIWWMNIWKIHGSTGEWSSSQNSHPFVLATERCNPYNDQSTKGLQGFWSLLAQFHPTWGWAQRTSPHLTSGREGPWIFSAMTRVLKSRGGPQIKSPWSFQY